MNDIYLNTELKEKYMIDFHKLLNHENDYWKIDKELVHILTRINSNPYVQTLYSKCGNDQDPNSYLEIAFTVDFERKLFRQIIPQLLFEFNKNTDLEGSLYYNYLPPSENSNYKAELEKHGIGCMDDPDYFRINLIKIKYICFDVKSHVEFWKLLSELLSPISEK